MGDYFNAEGEPIDLMEWARLFEIPEYRIVASDMINKIWVSTVWLGLDHRIQAFDPGPPLIYETMAFVVPQGDVKWDALETRRYSSHAAALAGHAEILDLVREIESINTQTEREHGREAESG